MRLWRKRQPSENVRTTQEALERHIAESTDRVSRMAGRPLSPADITWTYIAPGSITSSPITPAELAAYLARREQGRQEGATP